MVSTEAFWVPEHEETLRVFVPGYEAATHIRFYALWDERILGEAIFYGEKLGTPVYDIEYWSWRLHNQTFKHGSNTRPRPRLRS